MAEHLSDIQVTEVRFFHGVHKYNMGFSYNDSTIVLHTIGGSLILSKPTNK